MDKPRILGLIGLIALIPIIPALLTCVSFVLAVFSTVITLSTTGGSADPKILAGEISTFLVQQIVSIIVLLPGLILVSLASLKFKVNANWYKKVLRVMAWLSTLCLPLLVFVGIYLHWINRKTVA